jgi:hypothetical protein
MNRGGGRPTSLTPEVQEAIVVALRKGNYRQTAAAAAGVHRNRLAEWEKRGESGEEPFAEFMLAMIAAEAEAEMELVDEIRHARKDKDGADLWTSRAWILERRFAHRWSGRVKQQTAEAVDALTDKLKADPDLHRKVLDVLVSDQESAATGPGTGH